MASEKNPLITNIPYHSMLNLSHKRLDVYQISSPKPLNEVNEVTRQFPNEEKYALNSQVRRAAVWQAINQKGLFE